MPITEIFSLLKVNTFSDDPEVDQIVRRFLLDGDEKYVEPLRFGEDQSMNTGGENACDKYSCVDGVSASIRRLEGDCCSNKTMQQRQSVSNDIMDIYHKKFTKPKPFSPRTIKSNASSKLIGLRCYNPPKRVVRVCQPDSKVILDVKPVIRLNRSNSQCTTDSNYLIHTQTVIVSGNVFQSVHLKNDTSTSIRSNSTLDLPRLEKCHLLGVKEIVVKKVTSDLKKEKRCVNASGTGK
ncbi:unnamed protein product [Trichobilharzia regenti]|nr:unnamed protein product [Trichobilharzia regenti]